MSSLLVGVRLIYFEYNILPLADDAAAGGVYGVSMVRLTKPLVEWLGDRQTPQQVIIKHKRKFDDREENHHIYDKFLT